MTVPKTQEITEWAYSNLVHIYINKQVNLTLSNDTYLITINLWAVHVNGITARPRVPLRQNNAAKTLK